jgi:ATP-dependent RNA helicase RhlE
MPFTSLGLPNPITRGVQAAGYTVPTPIQTKAIPLILPGHDLVAASHTGSGKTAAFLLPILTRLLKGPRGLRALVLVPTRELAAQVESCAHEYARFSPLRVMSVYGGVPIGPQESRLRSEGIELLVATPGRLLDLNGRQSLSLDDVEILVLDEADRMVDMGFAPDLKRILRLLPEDRQTLMFSATMPRELNAVAQMALTNPRRLNLAPPTRPAQGIAQEFYPVPRHLKLDLLDRILRDTPRPSAIVFARTKRGAEKLARQLKACGHSAVPLHGDRTQSQRERALEAFRDGRAAVLVATDIASRGIDVDDVTHVVNFDVPLTPEDYVHRIGRTGRMDAKGSALTLTTSEEDKEVRAIERALKRKVRRITLPGFDYERRATAAKPVRNGGRRSAGRTRITSRSARTPVMAPSPPEPAYGRQRERKPSLPRRRRRL